MFNEILALIISFFLIYLSYQIGIKGNFKHTHVRDEWLKNLTSKEFYNLKKGMGLSYLLLSFICILIAITSNSTIVYICLFLIFIVVINTFRLGIKYINLK